MIFNNLSELSKPISDAISTAGEGGSNSQRALYTDEDESAIYSQAPFILVGINNVVTRGDLANRTLKTELAAMPKGEHLSETKFWAKVEKAAPVILGALLSALSEGLRRHDSIEEKGLPRLASFAKFVSACETCFWPAGTFLKAFTEAAADAADEVLSNDPVVEVFQEFMADKKEWKGTATVCCVSWRPLSGVRRERLSSRLRGQKTRPETAVESPASLERTPRRRRMGKRLDAWPRLLPILRRRASAFIPHLGSDGRRRPTPYRDD